MRTRMGKAEGRVPFLCKLIIVFMLTISLCYLNAVLVFALLLLGWIALTWGLWAGAIKCTWGWAISEGFFFNKKYFQLQFTFTTILYSFQKYSKVVRKSCTVQSGRPAASSTLLAPHLFILVLLTVFPVLYSREYYAKWSKPVRRRQIPYYFTYMKASLFRGLMLSLG